MQITSEDNTKLNLSKINTHNQHKVFLIINSNSLSQFQPEPITQMCIRLIILHQIHIKLKSGIHGVDSCISVQVLEP